MTSINIIVTPYYDVFNNVPFTIRLLPNPWPRRQKLVCAADVTINECISAKTINADAQVVGTYMDHIVDVSKSNVTYVFRWVWSRLIFSIQPAVNPCQYCILIIKPLLHININGVIIIKQNIVCYSRYSIVENENEFFWN